MRLKTLAIQVAITLGATLVLANLYAVWRLQQLQNTAYRSHDRFTTGKRYQSDLNTHFTNQFGDLCAIAGFSRGGRCPFWAGPRRHDLRTDHLGYKTLTPLVSADRVIAGDSFLAASGGDGMADQLGQQLQGLTGLRFYEAAHPGDPGDYLGRVAELEGIKPRGKAYLLLVFEGNDLARSIPGELLKPAQRPPTPNPLLDSLHRKVSWLVESVQQPPLQRLLVLVAEAAKARNEGDRPVGHGVQVVRLLGQSHGMLINNRDTSLDPSLRLPAVLRAGSLGWLAPHLLCIVIVPTKYSVHFSYRSLGERHPMLQRDLQDLQAIGIQNLDLTTALRQAATARPERPLYWRDDTHWNREGIRVAAGAMKADPRCLGLNFNDHEAPRVRPRAIGTTVLP
ncbi:MAG: hypothetical protein WCK64_10705 [Synechococcaceae cyanobacterium ELA445]